MEMLKRKFRKIKQSKKYVVHVDDNFHWDDEDEGFIYKLREFKNWEEAITACKKIIDEFLKNEYKKGIRFKGLYMMYAMFGEDPFIISDNKTCIFSCWDYERTL